MASMKKEGISMPDQSTSIIRRLTERPRIMNLPCPLHEAGFMFRHRSCPKRVSNLFFCLSWNRRKYAPDDVECIENPTFSIIHPGTLLKNSGRLLHDEIWLSYTMDKVDFFRQILPSDVFDYEEGREAERFRKSVLMTPALMKIIQRFYEAMNQFFMPWAADTLDMLALQLIGELIVQVKSDRRQYTENDLKILELAEQLKYGVPLPELIRSSGFGRRNFYLAWNRMFDVPPIQFKLRENLQNAANLLRRTDLSIGEIVEICRFNSTIYFHNQFKRMYGMTPGEYRKQELQ